MDVAENTSVLLTSDINFAGVPLKDFHEAAAGKKVGDAFEYKVTLPAEFLPKEHAGKEALIKTTVKSAKRLSFLWK